MKRKEKACFPVDVAMIAKFEKEAGVDAAEVPQFAGKLFRVRPSCGLPGLLLLEASL